jgi:hypothetical protein
MEVKSSGGETSLVIGELVPLVDTNLAFKSPAYAVSINPPEEPLA